MKKHIIALLVALSYFGAASAQDNRISISPELNVPLGKLAWSYKPSMGVQVNYSRISDSRITVESGVSVGYTSFAPLADTLYYVVDKGGVDGVGIGSAVFSPFRMMNFRATVDFGFPIVKERLSFKLGVGLGFLFGMRTIEYWDTFGASDSSTEIVGWGALTTKAGLEYKITERFSVTPFINYSGIIQAGDTDSDSMNYNENTGLFYHFYTPGLSLNFYF